MYKNGCSFWVILNYIWTEAPSVRGGKMSAIVKWCRGKCACYKGKCLPAQISIWGQNNVLGANVHILDIHVLTFSIKSWVRDCLNNYKGMFGSNISLIKNEWLALQKRKWFKKIRQEKLSKCTVCVQFRES